ncbi:MAG TPA: DUF5017 domain-containing protein [Bacteroidetes bacterium]|nr:DUF5017 domain-containing protein [Bacteroidota bacterium]
MNREYSTGLLTILGGILLVFPLACDREPVVPPMPRVEPVSIADLRAMYQGQDLTLDTAVYIQGIVTLTPELNNIPDFIAYLQDGTGGITLTISGNNTLASGSEVKVLCEGLTLTEYNGLLQFGEVDLATHSELIDLSAGMPEPVTVTIPQVLAGEHVAEYVEIAGVQFKEGGSFKGSKTLTDCVSEVAVFTRNEATFAGHALPAGNGTFRGVVSVYNTPQLIVADPADLDMTGERCGGTAGEYLNEDFESVENYDEITTLGGWTNPLEAGDRTWIAREYGGNTYAQATAYGSELSEMISWLITPVVNLSNATAPVLTFETATGYHNGATLEVLISTDYDGSGSPWNYTWTDLNPALANGPSVGYSAFVSSGNIDLSAYKSPVYIAFKYTGADPDGTASDRTTTWQIDNILIEENSE